MNTGKIEFLLRHLLMSLISIFFLVQNSHADIFDGIGACARDNSSIAQYPSGSGSPVDPSKIQGGSSIPIPSGNGNTTNRYAACSPSVIKFAGSPAKCNGSGSCAVNVCDIPPATAALSFSDCPNPNDPTKPGKPIKYRTNNVSAYGNTYKGAVNCDMDYMMSHLCSRWSDPNCISDNVLYLTNATDKSCIMPANFFGSVINTITTLGISNAMVGNFTSNVMQHHNACYPNSNPSLLEGAFLNIDEMVQNKGICPSGISQAHCIDAILKGYRIQNDSAQCAQNPKTCYVPLSASLPGSLGKIVNSCMANEVNCIYEINKNMNSLINESQEACQGKCAVNGDNSPGCVSSCIKNLEKALKSARLQCAENPTLCGNYVLNAVNNALKTQVSLSQNPCNSLPNYNRKAMDKDGNILTGQWGETLYCPLTRCNLPADDMMVNYDDASFHIFDIIFGVNNDLDINIGATKGTGTFSIISLKGITQGSQMCTSMLFTLGYTPISCKPRVMPTMNWPQFTPKCVSAACSVSQQAPPNQQDQGWQTSATFNSFSGKVVQCFTETIRLLMQGNPQVEGCGTGAIPQFQYNMRETVKVALVLYVILLGISIAIRGELPQKSEIAIFIAKISFVLWAGVGTFTDPTDASAACVGNKWCPTNGLEYIYNSLITFMEYMPVMMMEAVCNPANGDNCICSYSPDMYADGYGYLALWDSIDCRIMYYLGAASPTQGGAQSFGGTGGLGSQVAGGATFVGLFSLLFSFFFAFQLLIVLLMVVFAVLLLSIVVSFVNIYLLSLLSLTIIIYMGPIFVPMILFRNTQYLFKEWITLAFGYALQPTIITAFVAVMITIFDNIIYADCLFEQTAIQNAGSIKRFWIIKCLASGGTACACTESCKNSLGYIIASMGPGGSTALSSWPGNGLDIFNYYEFIALSSAYAIETALWQGAIFCFIFYYFSQQIANFAGDLTNSSSLGGQAISPTAVIDKVGYAAKIAAKVAYAAATKDMSGLKEEATKLGKEAIESAKEEITRPIVEMSGKVDSPRGASEGAEGPSGDGDSGGSTTPRS